MLDTPGYYFVHDSNYKQKVGGTEWCILEWTGHVLLATGNDLPMAVRDYDDFRYIELPPSKG